MLLITKVEPFTLNQTIYICDEEKQSIQETVIYALPDIKETLLSCVQKYNIDKIRINGCGFRLKEKIQRNLFSLVNFENIDIEIGD